MNVLQQHTPRHRLKKKVDTKSSICILKKCLHCYEQKNKAILIVEIIVFVLSSTFLYQGYVSHSHIIDQTISAREADLNNTIKNLTLFRKKGSSLDKGLIRNSL